MEARISRIHNKAVDLVQSGSLSPTSHLTADEIVSQDQEQPAAKNLAGSTQGDFALAGFKKIRQYGCFCNFVNFKDVRGEPVDQYDRFCKKLHDNYLCTIEESLAAGENSCHPQKDQYTSEQIDTLLAMAVAYKTIGYNKNAFDTLSMAMDYCDAVNDSVCMKGACKSETKFIFQVQPDIGMMDDPNLYVKEEYIRVEQGGVFDSIAQCPATGGGNVEPACCGLVPEANRFNSATDKQCCDNLGLVYSVFTQCCGKTSIKTIGDC